MIFGGGPFGGAPFGGGIAGDFSTPPAFEQLFADPSIPRIHYFEATVRGAPLFSFQTFFATDSYWRNRTVPVYPSLGRALSYRSSIASIGDIQSAGAIQVGSIELVGDTDPATGLLDIDAMRDFNWPGATVNVRVGAQGFTLPQFLSVFVGQAVGLSATPGGIEILVASPEAKMDVLLETGTYAGTGGIEGDAERKGQSRPALFGIARNFEPTLIDRANQVYQWHFRRSEAALNIYDDGSAFTSAGDVSDPWAWTPVGGQYVTDLSRGLFRLGGPPSGLVTMDAQGDAEGGYVETVADIVERVMRINGFSDSSFELSSFTNMNTDAPHAIGIPIPVNQRPTLKALVDQLVGQGSEPVGVPFGFSTWTREGRMRVGVKKVEAGTPDITVDAGKILRMRQETTRPPYWRWNLGYRPSWVVQENRDLDGAVGDAHRAFVGQDYRWEPAQDSVVKANHDKAEQGEIRTLIDLQADAQTEVARLLALTKLDRKEFEIDAVDLQYRLKPGQTVRLLEDKEWDEDLNVLVREVGEDSNSQVTSLGVWG